MTYFIIIILISVLIYTITCCIFLQNRLARTMGEKARWRGRYIDLSMKFDRLKLRIDGEVEERETAVEIREGTGKFARYLLEKRDEEIAWLTDILRKHLPKKVDLYKQFKNNLKKNG